MTADQIVALATSIGACLAAIAALSSVWLSGRQHRNSYKPELTIGSRNFRCISGESLAMQWEENNSENEGSFNELQIPLFNLGLGAAKNIQVKWFFPVDNETANANKLAQEALIAAYMTYKDGVVIMKSDTIPDAALFWRNEREERRDFIAPIAVEHNSESLRIPGTVVYLVSALVRFATKDLKEKEGVFNMPTIPDLQADIKFEDIGGRSHKTSIKLRISLGMVSSEGKEYSGRIVSVSQC